MIFAGWKGSESDWQ